jgi:cytochrome bd-type quinol oxidase subunit 2
METLWFALVAVMIAAYVVLDGFDLGTGIVYLFVARNDAERRTVLKSIGPFLGWERGLAARRRRYSVLRVPGSLRV